MSARDRLLLEAAERYIAAGLRVFLLASGSKVPPKGSRGFLDATGDLDELRQRLARLPGAGLAVATGEVSGAWVLDLDLGHGTNGLVTLEVLEDQHGELPETWVSETPRGGRHLWFAWPDDGPPIRSRAAVRPGLDVRGNGGYVVAPPTRLARRGDYPGGEYRWLIGQEPGEIPLAPAPAWLLELVRDAQRQRPLGGGTSAGADLQVIPEHQRNATLTSIAGRLRRDGLGAEELDAALQAINRQRCQPPLPAAEVARIAKSVSRYAPGAPLVPVPARGRADQGRQVEVGADPSSLVPEELEEQPTAEKLVRRIRGRFRYCWAWRSWLRWTGTRWVVDEGQWIAREMAALAEELSELCARQAVRAATRREAGEFLSFGRRCLRLRFHEHVMALARSAEGLSVDPAELDAHPLLLNTPSGVVDLRGGSLHPHDPALLLTKVTGCEFDLGAEAPVFQAFLSDVFGEDLELLAFVQRALGYSITGDTREQKFFLALGTGANGKTTLLEAVRHVLGDYGAATPFSTFLSSDRDGIPNDLARLRGARFITASEPERGRRFHEGRLKAWTGGDLVLARFLRQEFFEFRPSGKLWFSANYRPNVADDSNGFWRRCLIVPFAVTFPEEQQDPRLPEKLRAEGPGILRWLVEGAHLWQEQGLRPPPAVREAVQEYRSAEDVLGQFLEACCEIHPEAQEQAGALYSAYRRWAEACGFSRPMTQQAFGRRLGDRGFRREKLGGAWYRAGLRLRPLFDREGQP